MTKRANSLARTSDDIGAVALCLRRKLGVADNCTIDLVSLVEFGLPKLIPDFTFSVISDGDFESDVLALARENPPEIIVRESLYRQAAKQEPKAQWVIAHEIGHLLLQHARPAARKFNSQLTVDVASAEHEANLFAQYLLVPADLDDRCDWPSAVWATCCPNTRKGSIDEPPIRMTCPDFSDHG